MCGVGGYVDFRGPAERPEILKEMAARLRHRGPDAEGCWQEGPCGLAHTRLSILDLIGGSQPMQFADSDLVLSYNGELYNHVEQRDRLSRRGARFQTRSDTEVLLRGLAIEGRDFLHRLDAMFAFAAWDRRRETLLLARDGLGEKPLYYANPASGLLVFGSEIKAVLAHPEVDDARDEAALREVLRFRARYGEGTLRKGVKQLRPGQYLAFSRGGLTMGTFFSLVEALVEARANQRALSDRDLIGAGEAMFLEFVRRRLTADVPVGLYLSGGLDSSLIAAAMRSTLGSGKDIHTFSVGYQDDPRSELAQAEHVSRIVNAQHHAVRVGPADFISRWPALSARRDSPLSEPAEVAFATMSEIAKDRVSVALSGEGADEIFAGYPKYKFAATPWVARYALRLLGTERVSSRPANRTRRHSGRDRDASPCSSQ